MNIFISDVCIRVCSCICRFARANLLKVQVAIKSAYERLLQPAFHPNPVRCGSLLWFVRPPSIAKGTSPPRDLILSPGIDWPCALNPGTSISIHLQNRLCARIKHPACPSLTAVSFLSFILIHTCHSDHHIASHCFVSVETCAITDVRSLTAAEPLQ